MTSKKRSRVSSVLECHPSEYGSSMETIVEENGVLDESSGAYMDTDINEGRLLNGTDTVLYISNGVRWLAL